MLIKKIYSPKANAPMNCIAFASTSGSNIEALYKNEKGYKIRAVFVDKKCKAMDRAEKLGLPVIYESGVGFCGKRSDAEKNGPEAVAGYNLKCEEYENKIIGRLENFAADNNFNIDMLFLAGYMRLIRTPILERFKDRIINVHPANLAITDESDKRIYTGDNAVFDAIISGEKETYSSVHLVTKETDGGEMIVLSKPLRVALPSELEEIICETSILKKSNPAFASLVVQYIKDKFGSNSYQKVIQFTKEHQNKQKEHCDWPAYVRAAQLIAQGRVGISAEKNLSGLRTVYIDENPMPHEGYVLS